VELHIFKENSHQETANRKTSFGKILTTFHVQFRVY